MQQELERQEKEKEMIEQRLREKIRKQQEEESKAPN